jgi:two-component system, LytTR family, response regulator
MLTAIIVDDEKRSRDNLMDLLHQYCSDITILDSVSNINDAYTCIENLKPHIVFLDVDMPPYTGFDLLRKYDKIPFEVIFVTAYDFYAIDAIKFSALYYILKPVKVLELKEALSKAREKINDKVENSTQFFQELGTKSTPLQRIVVNSQRNTEIIALEDIYYLEADNVYITIHLKNNKKVICSQRSLNDYEEMLSDKGFFRTHRAYIVQLSEVESIDKTEGDEIILKNKQRIPLAKRRKQEFQLKL